MDNDSLAFFCTECQELYYYSEKRTRSIFLFFKLLLIIAFIIIGICILLNYINRPNIKDIIDFDLNRDSIAVKENFYPKILDTSIHSFTIDMGNGSKFESTLPDSFHYTKPGYHEIKFNSDQISDKINIIVYDPSIIKISEQNKIKKDILSKVNRPKTIEPQNVSKETPIKIEETKSKTNNKRNKTIREKGKREADCPNLGEPCNDYN